MYTDYELYHHGILGQKWGKKNGPPYPLNGSDHSSSEKKAGWRKSLDKSSGSTHTKSSSSDEEKHSLTDKQKRAIKIGVTVAAAALAVGGTIYLKKSGKLDQLVDKGESIAKSLLRKNNAGNIGDFGNFGDLKVSELPSLPDNSSKVSSFLGGIKKLARAESLSETISKVNPHRGDPDYKNNCTYCSVTAFLRQKKGLDLTAGKTYGQKQNLGGIVENCFQNAKVFDGTAVKFGQSKQAASEMLLKRFGENAEGVCAVGLKGGGGHAFNWSITNGIVSFFDSQNNWNDEQVGRFWSQGLFDTNGVLQIARLDGLEINIDGIKKITE